MKKTLLIFSILACTLAGAQNLQQSVARITATNAALKGAQVGIAVQDLKGRPIYLYNADVRMAPASNMKLLTTGTALHRLGSAYTFKTGLGYTGSIEGGVLNGDLYIIGGGDPTTAAKDTIADAMSTTFRRWQRLLKKAGISAIDGRVIGDGRAWEGYLENSNWTWDDIGTYYGTGAAALNFYANVVDLEVYGGPVEGDPVEVEQSYPETPWMHNTNRGITGREGTGNSLYLFTTDLAPYAELRGSYAIGRDPKTEHFANKFGALTCAYYFANFLNATGIPVSGGYADIDRGGRIRGADFVPGDPAGAPEIIGSTDSPELFAIARETNLRSDNFYAEALFRTLGKTLTGSAQYDSCRVAERAILQTLAVDPTRIILDDGCGLSRKNAASARFFADFLCAMASSPAFESFLNTLPTPSEGTLSTLLRGRACAPRYRLKSGSMEGVLCYSGYLLDSYGTPIATVSVLVNGADASTSRIRNAVEGILTAVAEEIPAARP